MKDRRIVNFRTFAFSAVACAAMVLSFTLFYKSAVLSVILAVVSALAIVLACVIYRKNAVRFFGCIIVLIAFIACFLSCLLTVKERVNHTLFAGERAEKYNLVGTIEQVYDDGLSKRLLVKTASGESYGNVMVYLSEENRDEIKLDGVHEGDGFNAVATLNKVEFIDDDGVNGYYYRLDVRYTTFLRVGDFTVTPADEINVFDYIRKTIKSVFVENLGKEYGSVAYGMVIGDKSQLDVRVKDSFGVAGIGHILAVSGLHVMFLASVISFICKTLKAKRAVNLVVTAAVLLLYNVLVGFTASVVRASIMSMCFLFSSATGERNDGLNNLGLACSVYLVARPFALFDVGFVLSVCAVLGIVFFLKPISGFCRRITKNKFGKIIDSVALPVSAQIGITPAMLYYFGRLSVYSVLTNVLLSYVVMFTFIALFAAMTIALVMPFAGAIVKIAYPGLWILDKISAFVANLYFSSVIVYAGKLVFTLYVAFFLISRFFMAGKLKPYVVTICIIYCVCVVAGFNAPFTVKSDRLYCYPDSFGQVVSVVTFDENKTALVADITGSENLTDRLSALKIRKLDEIVLQSADYPIAREIVLLSQKLDVGAVFVREYGEAVKLFDDYGVPCCVLKDGEKTPLGFRFEQTEAGLFVRLTRIDEIMFAPSDFVLSRETERFVEDCTLLRVRKVGGESTVKALENKISEAETYYYDVKTGKIENFN